MEDCCRLRICGALRDLVLFAQFNKREKHPWRSVTFSKPATLLKVTLLHGCFSRFLNCTNSTKSFNAPHIFKQTAGKWCCFFIQKFNFYWNYFRSVCGTTLGGFEWIFFNLSMCDFFVYTTGVTVVRQCYLVRQGRFPALELDLETLKPNEIT